MKRLYLRIVVISITFLLLLMTIFTFNGASNVALADSQVAYSLVIRNRNPTIKPGDTLEIDVLISGYGVPEKNKLMAFWSSDVIDKDHPGTYEVLGKPPNGIDPNGLRTIFDNDVWSISSLPQPLADFGFPMIQTETALNGKFPYILKLKTADNATTGDYDVSFVFTYSDKQSMYQDYKTTQFHISSSWERNQLKYQITAILIALASLIIGAVFSWLNYRKTRKRAKS